MVVDSFLNALIEALEAKNNGFEFGVGDHIDFVDFISCLMNKEIERV